MRLRFSRYTVVVGALGAVSDRSTAQNNVIVAMICLYVWVEHSLLMPDDQSVKRL
jgi:hypothetical protein